MSYPTTNPSPTQSTLAPSEKHLEEWIVSNLDLFRTTYEDGSPGLFPYTTGVLKRQPRFPSGIPDLIMSKAQNQIVVVELKRESINAQTVMQCLRYMYDLRYILLDVLRSRHDDIMTLFDIDNAMNYFVRGILVGHSIADQSLFPGFEVAGLEVVTYSYTGQDYKFAGYYYDGWVESHGNWANGAVGDYLDLCIQAWKESNRW